jgi:hypothetical protein
MILIAPFGAKVFKIGEYQLKEQRTLQQEPKWDTKQVLTGYYQFLYEQYINDHFGLRPIMVDIMKYVFLERLGQSYVDRVLLGKDGWLFLNDDNQILQTQGLDLFSEKDLELLKKRMKKREEYFSLKKIPYVLVIIPNKQTVYPEFLPYDVPDEKITKTDQFISVINNNTSISVIDLRNFLVNLKDVDSDELYFKTDTHWNGNGAYAAYQYVFTELYEKYPDIFKEQAFISREQTTGEVEGGDLARMLGNTKKYKEKKIFMIPKEGSEEKAVRINIDVYSKPNKKEMYAYVQENNLPRAVIFRDSFTNALLPAMGEQFSRSAYIWSPEIYDSIIEVEQPDIVIQFMVERFIPLLKEESQQL